ncbi:MAG TPA: radical SAM protein [Magnetospirillum sp.]|nr:radical SAM protein [Magnetospirillum sp.]
MRILLIYPPFATTWPLGLGLGEPLGIAYIAAAIEQSGRHGVDILDAVGSASEFQKTEDGEWHWVGLSHEQVLADMGTRTFDAIGISVSRTSSVDTGVEALIRAIRQAFPTTPLIVGGPEVSHCWDRYIANLDIDYIVIGEGEKTIVELLDALDGVITLDQVRGIIRRSENGEPIKAPDQPAQDVDTIPWPARHLLPMDTYIEKRPTTELRAATILTSRACPFRCAFCSTIHIWGNRWRGRSAADVVDEIAFLKARYGIEEIRIQDDNFCVKKRRVHEICDLMKQRALNVRLHVDPGVMAALADRELLSALYDAGLRNLNMQLESGSPKTQSYIDKKIDLDHVREMLDWSHHLGMFVRTNIILGFPHETLDDMRESVRTAIELPYDMIDFNLLEPKRYTRAWRDFVSLGLLSEDDIDPTIPVGTVHCSAQEVLNIQQWAVGEFRRSRQTLSLGRERVAVPGEIRIEQGHCFIIRLPEGRDIADHADNPMQSPLRIFEDDAPLTKAHSQHDIIRTLGNGSYSHWGDYVYFSSLDNSDPRVNGRTYRLFY